MGNALLKKLRAKSGQTITVVNSPKNYEQLFGNIPADIKVSFNQKQKSDHVHLFAKCKAELDKWFLNALGLLHPNGILWVAFPKGTSGMQTDLTRDQGWEKLTEVPNLQFLTLISLDDTWSAIAFRMYNETSKLPSVTRAKPAIIDQYIDSKKKMVIIPEDLQTQFTKHTQAADFFNSLAFTHRKEYVVWIISAKQQTTRDRRVKTTIEKLESGVKSPK